jgi:hypothetical protein
VLAWELSAFEVTRSRRRGIAYGNEDELGLAAAEGLQGAAVAQHNLTRLEDEGKLLSVLAKKQQVVETKTDLGADGLRIRLGLLGGHCDGTWLVKRRRVEMAPGGDVVVVGWNGRSRTEAESQVGNILCSMWNSRRRSGLSSHWPSVGCACAPPNPNGSTLSRAGLSAARL